MLGRRFYFATLVGFVAYVTIVFNQIPVPDDIEEPNGYRLVSLFVSFSGLFIKTFKYLGIGTEHGNLKTMEGLFRTRDKIENVELIDRDVNGTRVRLYRLPKLDKSAIRVPGLIFYHGGGFSLGNIDGYDNFLSNLVENLGINVVSVDYRLAPHHPFPVPTDDCYAVTNYVFEHSDEFLIDPDRVILAGDSAGGNIVAAVAQRLLKEGKQLPKLQVMIYPWLQMFNMQLPSFQIYNEKGIFSSLGFSFGKMVKWYLGVMDDGIELLIDNNKLSTLLPPEQIKQIDAYLDIKLIAGKYVSSVEKEYYTNYTDNHEAPSDPETKTVLELVKGNEKLRDQLMKAFTPEVSPVMAGPERIKGLPKAYFVIAEWDTLKDEGLIYAERLSRAGVDVTMKYYPGAFHGVINFHQLTKTKMISKDLIAFIKANI